MKQEIASILICPKCKSFLELEIKEKSKNRINQGILRCEKCNSNFQIIDDIVCFKKITKKDKNLKKIEKIRKMFFEQEVSTKWLKHFNKKEQQDLKKEWKWLINSSDLKNSKIHLDWASGTGRFLRNILDVVKGEIIALEIDYPTCLGLRDFLKKIGKYSNVTIIRADVKTMPLVDNSVDSVTSWHGPDEPDMNKAINESKRILKRNRSLSVSGLSFEENSKSLKIALKWKINFARKDKIQKYFEKVGFRDIKYRTFYQGKWTEKGDFLPKFGDYFSNYGISGRK